MQVVIESDRTRERSLNLTDALDKLRSTIYEVQREMVSRKETEVSDEYLLNQSKIEVVVSQNIER